MTTTAIPEDLGITFQISATSWPYLMQWFDEGADKEPIPVKPPVPPTVFTELEKKRIVKREGQGKGRGKPGTVFILVTKDKVFEGKPRKPRETTGAERKPRAPREAAKPNVMQLPASIFPLNHADVRRYLDAVSPNAQREYEKERQTGISDTLVAKEIKGLKGSSLIAKLHEIENRHEMTFEQYIRQTYGTEMVQILGIPEVGQDLADGS